MKPGLSGVEALPNEAWLALMRKLCPMRPGWRWCGALLDEAWFTSVWSSAYKTWLALVKRLCPMRPGWR